MPEEGTKVLLDGFLVDVIALGDDPLTPTVKEILKEAERVVAAIVPIPPENPNIILISTELD